ncbi:hypothetical protein FTX61_21550 [Nitriliruptoraceae bacterium ZYF776]|nr:hypothetical protein [Profundirhabdus halotolerans]
MDDVNRVFARNGVAFTLRANGTIDRLVPHVVATQLGAAEYNTGDSVLDGLLEDARSRFVDPRPRSRRDAVEKLWDAFERAKTVRGEGTKAATADRLLDAAASTAEFRAVLAQEARELSRLGNTFRIRHSELAVIELDDSEFDYVFVRLYALLWLLLRERSDD